MSLKKFQEFGESKAALPQNIRKRTFCDLRMDGNNGLPNLIACSFFQGNVATLLAELNEPTTFSALTTRSPDTLGRFGMSSRNFDGCPELRRFGGPPVRSAPSFEVKLDSFA